MAVGTATSNKKREGTRGQKKKIPDTPDEPEGLKNPVISALLARYSLTLIVFFISLFFIITFSNPALFLNDEWISANQLHQLDIGHQVVVNEAKYGVTKNGTISLYFVETQKNLLLYSLALPVAALPITKLFDLFGDNFRLIVILLWSLIPVLLCLIIEAGYPRYRKIHGIRLSLLGVLFGMFLFLCNTLLYKQFAYSAIDAPYEVAALVLTNHLLFAVTAAVIFETGRVIFKDRWMALFCTFACVSCSSFIFWAGPPRTTWQWQQYLPLSSSCSSGTCMNHHGWTQHWRLSVLGSFSGSGLRSALSFSFVLLFFSVYPVQESVQEKHRCHHNTSFSYAVAGCHPRINPLFYQQPYDHR